MLQGTVDPALDESWWWGDLIPVVIYTGLANELPHQQTSGFPEMRRQGLCGVSVVGLHPLSGLWVPSGAPAEGVGVGPQ